MLRWQAAACGFLNTPAPDVTLLATEDTAPLFEAAPQWKEFDIQVKNNTDVGGVTAPDMTHLAIRSDGDRLYITAGRAISRLELYATDGRMVADDAVSPAACEASTATGHLAQGSVVILRIIFDDHSTATAKIKI